VEGGLLLEMLAEGSSCIFDFIYGVWKLENLIRVGKLGWKSVVLGRRWGGLCDTIISDTNTLLSTHIWLLDFRVRR
jgi:hypothetical protein